MKSKRTVGIITMHRPVSFGSSLQAYALQRKIESMGYDCEIIDYKYPNRLHYGQKPLSRRMTQFVRFMLNLPLGFPNVIEKIRFSLFRKRYLKLSSHYYDTAEKLCVAPPEYDVYCTGSDQVWNSLFTKSDTSFLLSFVPENRRKVSYASSFAVDYIKAGYEQTYKKYLSEYSHISVRESSGIRIIKELLDRSAQLVCDPTILLTRKNGIRWRRNPKSKLRNRIITAYNKVVNDITLTERGDNPDGLK